MRAAQPARLVGEPALVEWHGLVLITATNPFGDRPPFWEGEASFELGRTVPDWMVSSSLLEAGPLLPFDRRTARRRGSTPSYHLLVGGPGTGNRMFGSRRGDRDPPSG